METLNLYLEHRAAMLYEQESLKNTIRKRHNYKKVKKILQLFTIKTSADAVGSVNTK